MSFEPVSDVGNLPIFEGGSGGGGGGGFSITIGTTVIPLGGTALILDGLTSVTSALFVGNLIGSASSTQNLILASSSANSSNYVTFSNTASGSSSILTNPNFRFNPATGTLTVTNFAGNGSGLTNIPNSALLNSSITIGSTILALGSTTTTLAGLTSVTSTTFVGNLNGIADRADLIKLTNNVDNQMYHVLFANSLLPYSSALYNNSLTYNPSNGTLVASFFSGNGSGLTNIPNSALVNSSVVIGTTNISLGASTLVLAGLTNVTSTNFTGNLIGTADFANGLNLTVSVTNANYYLPFSLNPSGNNAILTGSLRYNPSTNVLTSGTFSGSGALLTNIPNGALVNSTITIGTTIISLGGSSAILSGLTSVTSTTFVGNLTGNADSASLVSLSVSVTNLNYYLPFSANPSGNNGLLTGSLRYNPSTNVLTSGSFSGSGALLTGIPNSALINSSITIGSTNIPLGTTVSSISGLNDITSGTFIGNLQGNATSADSINLRVNGDNQDFYVPFSRNQDGPNTLFTGTLFYNPRSDTLTVGNISANIIGAVTDINVANNMANTNYSVVFSSVNAGVAQLYTDVSGFTYNPTLNSLSSVIFVGNLTGTASNVNVTNNITNTAFSMVFSSVNTGSALIHTDTTGFTYNPSTNILTVGSVTGNLTGTATNATNVNVVTTNTNATHFVNFTAASTGNTPVRALAAFTFNPSTQILTVANIVATTGYNITNTVVSGSYPLLFSSTATGSNLIRAGGSITYNPATNVLTSGSFSGSGALLTGIPNGALVNSSITIGTTTISLGASSLTLAGLTSVTSTTFVGALTGTADVANSLNLTNNTTNASFLVTFAAAAGVQNVFTGLLSYNPSTNILTSGTFSGSGALLTNIPNAALTNSTITIGTTAISLGASSLTLAGLTSVTSTTFVGALTGNASSATLIGLTDVGLNASYNVVFTNATVAGNSTISKSSGNNLTFNPSTGFLTATRFVGSGAGLTGIPNTALVNSAITIGTTAISLGASSLTLAGLTSVTSTTFVGALTGNASSATQVNLTSVVTNANFNLLFSNSITGNSNVSASGNNNLLFNPSTGVLTTTQFSGSGAGLTSIPNTALVNSSITIGTTTISLGVTVLTLAGLTSVTAGTFNGSGAGLTSIPNSALVNSSITLGTSTVALGGTLTNISGLGTVTATTFVGNFSGTVTDAQNLQTTSNAANSTFYIPFVTNATTSIQQFFVNSGISLNPSTSTITATNFSGTATNSTNSAITAVATNADFYLTFSAAKTGNNPLRAANGDNLLFNPSTGVLTAGQFSGSGAGLTSIPNSALTNSSITIGTTTIALGASSLTLAGLTSVTAGTFNGSGAGLTSIPNAALVNSAITIGTTSISLGSFSSTLSGLSSVNSTTFIGSLTGTATNANNLLTTVSSTNASFYLTFVPSALTSTQAFSMNSSISVNPSTGNLSATSFSGSGAGLTNIPNSALTNNSITIGTTTIALGATTTVLNGLTSVTAGTLTATSSVISGVITTNAGDLSISSDTNIVTFGTSQLFFSSATAQAFLNASLNSDTFQKISLHTTNGMQLGPGTSAQDIRIYRTGASTVTVDNNAGGSATMNIANLTNVNSINVPTAASTNYDAIVFSAGAINTGSGSGPRINLGASFSNLGDDPLSAKLVVAGGYGLGVGGARLNYYAPLGGGHRFYCADVAGSVPVLDISTGGISIRNGVNLTTNSGDLVISPAGSNVNFNGKNLTNINSVTATSFLGTATSATNITINTPIASADILYSSTLVNTTGAGVPLLIPNDQSSYQYNPQLLRNYIGNSTFPQNNYSVNTTSNRISFNNLPNLVRTKQPTTGMQAIACNASGRVVAVANSTQLLVSQDYGSTFAAPISIPGITAIAMCNLGQYIVTNNTDNTNISVRISTDYGTTFNQVIVAAVASTPVTWVSISGNCRYIVVNTGTTTQYISSNYGSTWTTISFAAATGAVFSAISTDGRYIAINSVGGPYILSQNYGATFTASGATLITGMSAPAISDDFRYIYLPYSSGMFRSTDYGTNFAGVSYGATITSYVRFRCSTDGRILVQSIGSTINQTRYSQDFGQTFANFSSSNMTGLAMPDNGQFFYLIDSGNLYQYGNAVTLSNYGSADIAGVMTVGADTIIGGSLITNGNSIFNGDLSLSGTITGNRLLNTDTTLGTLVYSGLVSNTALYVTNNLTGQSNTGASIVLQSVLSPAGFMAINFNGVFNGAETIFNTLKTRWRVTVNQSSSNDAFAIDNYNGTTFSTYVSITRSTVNTLVANYPNTYNTNFFAPPRGYNDLMSGTIIQNVVGNTADVNSTGATGGSFTIPANVFNIQNGAGFELYFRCTANFGASTNVSLQTFINNAADGVATIYSFGAANATIIIRARFIRNGGTGNTATFRFISEALSATAGRISTLGGTYNPTTDLSIQRTLGIRLLNNAAVVATVTVSFDCVTLTVF